MKKLFLLATLAGILSGCASVDTAEQPKEPRKIAVQTYSLNRFTLEDSLQKLKPLKLDGVECYPGQQLSAKYPNVKVGPNMNAEQRAYMKKLLAESGLKMVSFGVASIKDDSEAEPLCQFVKEMGGKRVITESPVYFWPSLQTACEKYDLEFCVHHHATNSSAAYWDTDFVNKHIKKFSLGRTNPDIGHWARSGIDPVESLKAYEGNIGSIHVKDEREFGNIKKDHCVPLGKGAIDMKAVLAELDRQGYDGFFVIEYENEWDNNIPQIKECVEYLRRN